MYILHQLGWGHKQTPTGVSDMQRIAYNCSFIPCKNQKELLTSWVVFAVNIYECVMENKNITAAVKLSEKQHWASLKLYWFL